MYNRYFYLVACPSDQIKVLSFFRLRDFCNEDIMLGLQEETVQATCKDILIMLQATLASVVVNEMHQLVCLICQYMIHISKYWALFSDKWLVNNLDLILTALLWWI